MFWPKQSLNTVSDWKKINFVENLVQSVDIKKLCLQILNYIKYEAWSFTDITRFSC